MEPLIRSEAFQAGQSLGKFYLVRQIGAGGTSRIFKALQQPIDRIVALKIPSFAGSEGILSPDEFLSEATLMAKLDHSNIVRIHDFGVLENHAFICMEYVDGASLADLVEDRGPLSPAAAAALGIQVLEGLAHAHVRGVLHLDLSPANVLVGRNGTAKLSDFGMAGKGRGKPAGRIIGTPAALSPEHVAGTECSARSDLFSFGSLLYYAARGEPLFDPGPGNSRVTEAMREIESARARPPEDRLRALPPPLAGAVRMALQGSAGAEVAAELRAAFREECGDADPALILGREAGGGESGDAGPAQKGDALRAEYRRLRAQGRHREAVGLLERALRRHPEDPVLRELLAEPPVPRNSGGATMEVNTGSPASPMPESEDARRRTGPAAWIGAGALALFLGLFAWTRAGSRPGKPGVKESAEFPSAAPGPARPAGSASPSGSSSFSKSGAIAPAKLEALPPPAPKDAPGKRHPTAAAVREAASPAPAGRRRPLPPALTLSGSAGTRITVNDTLAWTAPAPPDGWPVSPGLLTLTLAPAGEGRPITTRLFAAADTLYEFRLDGKGGFSVARRRR